MNKRIKLLLRIVVIINLVFLTGCTSAKPIPFKSPVNTTTKPITIQVKKVFSLNDVGVFASNQFDGARLNGFEKINDSTVAVIINPEATKPIKMIL